MIKAAFWSIFDRILVQLINFAITIIIARYLVPAELSTIAIITAYIYFLNIFVDSGLTISIIRNQNISDREISAIFVFNLIISIFLIVLTLFTSNSIEFFFEVENLSFFLNISSLILFFNAFSFVRYARLEQKMNFKLLSIINLISIIISGVVCFIMLKFNYGIMAVVVFNIISSFIKNLLYIIFTPMFKIQRFSFSDFKPHFYFGKNLLVSSGVEAVYNHAFPVVIAKLYSPHDAGLFFQSKRLIDGVVGLISGASRRLFLPIASKEGNNLEKTKELLMKILKVVNYITIFIVGVFFINSELIITSLMGDKWVESVPIFRILSIGMIFYAPFFLCIDVFKVQGDSHLYSKLIVYTRIFSTVLVLLSSFLGFTYLVYFFSLSQLLMFLYAVIQIHKKYDYSIGNIFSTIFPFFSIFLLSLCGAYGIVFLDIENKIFFWGLQTVVFSLLYTCLIYFLFKYIPLKATLMKFRK
ncbi:oligosaccharide flippase family protein [Proteiniphilum sp.]|uniref:oligosaccharide flippase family protein n=1 Tax=Proteiniphilum sp. TaxID=1926877 RepID=UPI0033311E1C